MVCKDEILGIDDEAGAEAEAGAAVDDDEDVEAGPRARAEGADLGSKGV